MEKITKKSCELSQNAKETMTYINKIAGLDRFILYGGAPIDLAINDKAEINDYDIAINSKSPGKIKDVVKFLVNNGFEIVEPGRKYYIYNDIEVILIYARKDNILLDICFMEDVSLVGQFNIESLYWKYPEMECIDKYDAAESIKKKELVPIRGIENENIFLLISRFVYLCSKYDISLFGDGGKFIDSLNKKLSPQNITESWQFVSCLSSIFKSILKAKDRIIFIKGLIDSDLIKKIFPLLNLSLINFLQNNYDSNFILKIKDKKSLLLLLEDNLNKNDKEVFRETVKVLSGRIWDKQDTSIT